jgi:hypothetical protein
MLLCAVEGLLVELVRAASSLSLSWLWLWHLNY